MHIVLSLKKKQKKPHSFTGPWQLDLFLFIVLSFVKTAFSLCQVAFFAASGSSASKPQVAQGLNFIRCHSPSTLVQLFTANKDESSSLQD